MHLYSHTQLHNRYVHEQAAYASEDKLLSKASLRKINEAYPDLLYTPNLFIGIALGLLTIVALLFSAGLFGLLFWSSEASTITGLVFLAILCYIALEIFVRKKNFYNAGVDNMLMIAILLFIAGAFFVAGASFDPRLLFVVMMLLSGWLCLRFTDAFMAVLSYVSLFILLFLSVAGQGSPTRMMAPFIMMALSAGMYALSHRQGTGKDFRVYYRCYTAIRFCTLLSFYISCNYYVVNTTGIEYFETSLTASTFMAGLFWIFTVALPLAYFGLGILSKDRLLIRTGLLLAAPAVFTVRYYYAVFSLEVSMLVAGTLLIATSYALIKYLHKPRHGFVFKTKEAGMFTPEGESLVTTEQFGATVPGDTFTFGSGSGSGAGASGQY